MNPCTFKDQINYHFTIKTISLMKSLSLLSLIKFCCPYPNEFLWLQCRCWCYQNPGEQQSLCRVGRWLYYSERLGRLFVSLFNKTNSVRFEDRCRARRASLPFLSVVRRWFRSLLLSIDTRCWWWSWKWSSSVVLIKSQPNHPLCRVSFVTSQ